MDQNSRKSEIHNEHLRVYDTVNRHHHQYLSNASVVSPDPCAWSWNHSSSMNTAATATPTPTTAQQSSPSLLLDPSLHCNHTTPGASSSSISANPNPSMKPFHHQYLQQGDDGSSYYGVESHGFSTARSSAITITPTPTSVLAHSHSLLAGPPQSHHQQFLRTIPATGTTTTSTITKSTITTNAAAEKQGRPIVSKVSLYPWSTSASGYDVSHDHCQLVPGMAPYILHSQGEYMLPNIQLELGTNPTVQATAYSYLDPYFGGILANYGGQPVTPSQLIDFHHARMPLPTVPTEEEPVYVNAKQYAGILRRRHRRAKLESENKLVRSRKPYLHESRHLHAMRRARGCGGRFLNTKKKDESLNSFNNNVSSEGAQSSQEGTTIDSNETGMTMECGVESQEQEGSYNTMHGLGNHLALVGMSRHHQSIRSDGTSDSCSAMVAQNSHPIISSGVPFGT